MLGTGTGLIWVSYHILRTVMYYRHVPYIWGIVALLGAYLLVNIVRKSHRHNHKN